MSWDRRDGYISSPRPLFKEEELVETNARRVITLGSNNSGIVVRVTKKGIEFNGYYAGLTEASKYAIMREFILVSWDDFDKLREAVFRRKPIKKKLVVRDPDFIDDKPDQKYLDALPQVTLNGKKYYIDADRKERRPVDNPAQVFNFETQAIRKPT
jgi:hypothetical protein